MQATHRRLAGAIALWVACVAIVVVRYRAPRPLGLDAPAGEFSAARAWQVLERLIGDGRPHPAGSEAHAALRQRLLEELRATGWQAEIQESFTCGPYGTCATVRNVLATRSGPPPAGPLLAYLCHYDSVPAGPGVSDDALGVAAGVEIARALAARPASGHPIVLVFTDGEELGLLGAEALRQHPLWERIAVFVNVEARGTRGPSVLFETGGGSADLIAAVAGELRRPVMTSLTAAVYRRLPNDTDLTVVNRSGKTGINFAMVGGVAHYHTPLDDLAHASRSTLQHHGQNALAALRGLSASRLPPRPGDAVYFDVAALAVVRWPAGATRWLALAALALWLVAMRRTSGGAIAAGALGWGALLAVGATAGAAALTAALAEVLRRPALLVAGWPARPLPVILLAWAVAATVALALTRLLARRAGPSGLFAGTLLLQLALALLAAFQEPGAAYLFLAPALVGSAAAAALKTREGEGVAGGALALHLASTAILGLPVAVLLYDAMGVPGLPAISWLVALSLLPLAPALAEVSDSRTSRNLTRALTALVLVLVGTIAASPPYTPESPGRLSFVFHHDADSGQSRWLLRTSAELLPGNLAKGAGFRMAAAPPFPWSPGRSRVYAVPAPREALEPPGIAVLSEERSTAGRVVKLRLVSPRRASRFRLLFPPGTTLDVRFQGVTVPRDTASKSQRFAPGWRAADCRTVPPEGLEVELAIPGHEPVTAVVWEESYALPGSGAAMTAARPAFASPSDDGDLTVVTAALKL